MATPRLFVTASSSLSWAETGPPIEKARVAQVAVIVVRIFMGFLPLACGRCPYARPETKHQECERIVYYGQIPKLLSLNASGI